MASLAPSAVAYLEVGGQETAYPDGEVILRRGQTGRAFYVVQAGCVEVLLEAEDGHQLPLARLGEGASFGEMSLLAGEPVSADVVACGEVCLLEYPGEKFRAALGQCEPLRDHILTRFVDRLRQTNSKAWGLYQRSRAMAALMDSHEPAGPVVAESSAMQRAVTRLGELAETSEPVLVTGEPGVGKRYLACEIHRHTGADSAPLIAVDCEPLAEGEAGVVVFGTAGPREFVPAESGAVTLPVLGALDLADGGTLVLPHVEATDAACQAALWAYIEAAREYGPDLSPAVRVIATTAADLAALADEGQFHAQLAERLCGRALAVPPLRKRGRDVLGLAKVFLAEHDAGQETEHWFNRSAEHALVSASYMHRNVAELREAVESAAVFAEADEIGSEHIFTGPQDECASLEHDLGASRPVRWLLEGWGLVALRAGTLGVFLAIMAACLWVPGTWIGQVANGLVWGLWWPVLMVLFLFVGRMWCTVCAISLIGRIARRVVCLSRKPPTWMKAGSPWLAMSLFVLIVWVEHVFRMPARPFATGILLVALMGAASLFCMIYQREAWCRHLCPLGGLAAGYSAAAVLQVHATPGICATQCRTHECFKGSDDVPGCAVFHHPMYARDGQFCKLCLTCLKACPHGSARLFVRLPLAGLTRRGSQSEALAPLSLVVFFLSLVMLASHRLSWLADPVAYTATVLATVALGVGLWWLLVRVFRRAEDDASGAVARVTLVLLVLAAGPLMAFHLANVPGLRAVAIAVPARVVGSFPAEGVHLPVLIVLQVTSVLVCAALGGIGLWRVGVRWRDEGYSAPRYVWPGLRVAFVAYLVGTLLLLLWPGGAHG